MKYLVRINLKSINPITKRVIASRLWEVEQVANKDSEKVIWHSAEVKVDGTPVRLLFVPPKPGESPWQGEYYGICIRGMDDAIEIRTGPSEVSGNKN